MNLSERLLTIANCINKGDIVADIGTDHGYIPIFLVENNISHKIIASDISQGPVDNAMKSINEYKYNKWIKVIKSPGLKSIKSSMDSIIIAGMGGLMIIDIIKDDLMIAKASKKLVLQPMNNSIELRIFLQLNDFKIIIEKIAIEGNKFYEVIVCENGKDIIKNEFEYEVSDVLKSNIDNNTRKFIKKKIETTKGIIAEISKNGQERSSNKLTYMKDKLKYLLEVYQDEN